MYLVQWVIFVPIYAIRIPPLFFFFRKAGGHYRTYFQCTGKVVFYFEVKAFVHVAT